MHLFCLESSVIHWGWKITQVSRILSTGIEKTNEEIASSLFLRYPISAHEHRITMCAKCDNIKESKIRTFLSNQLRTKF
jgi:hypothetical protein